MNPDLAQPAPSVVAAALQWLDGTLLGTVATVVAVLAVASVGLLLMTGRIDMRRAAQVVAGCFILFGASSIASGIMLAVAGASASEPQAPPPVPRPIYSAPPMRAAPPQAPYDPYAGAAMPSD